MRVDASSSSTTSLSSDSISAKTLGKDFLQLLVTQLENQDPLQPMQDRELISQLAQLSSLDTLQRIEKLSTQEKSLNQFSQAAALIGHWVKAIDADGSLISGKATSAIANADGSVSLTVGMQIVDLESIVQVSDPT